MTNLIKKGKVVGEETIGSQSKCEESLGYQSKERGITRLLDKLTKIQMQGLDAGGTTIYKAHGPRNTKRQNDLNR